MFDFLFIHSSLVSFAIFFWTKQKPKQKQKKNWFTYNRPSPFFFIIIEIMLFRNNTIQVHNNSRQFPHCIKYVQIQRRFLFVGCRAVLRCCCCRWLSLLLQKTKAKSPDNNCFDAQAIIVVVRRRFCARPIVVSPIHLWPMQENWLNRNEKKIETTKIMQINCDGRWYFWSIRFGIVKQMNCISLLYYVHTFCVCLFAFNL